MASGGEDGAIDQEEGAKKRNFERVVLGVVFIATAAAASIVILSYLTQSRLDLPSTPRAAPYVRVVFPQGWAFFTKSPREPELTAYQLDADSRVIQELNSGPNATPKWYFGINRTARSQEYELRYIAEVLGNVAWTQCEDGARLSCLQDIDDPGHKIHNPFALQTICGRVALVRHTVIPWAYANRGLDTVGSAEAKLTYVICESID